MNILRFELDRGMKDRGNELLSTAESSEGSLELRYRCVTLQVAASLIECATMEVMFTGAYPM